MYRVSSLIKRTPASHTLRNVQRGNAGATVIDAADLLAKERANFGAQDGPGRTGGCVRGQCWEEDPNEGRRAPG